jgi:alkanesulfonate monooxygenase SsuD/methylene tetrahydromethanopterin reductase-like flavin-dependent oxidoreductase (luciferase family)
VASVRLEHNCGTSLATTGAKPVDEFLPVGSPQEVIDKILFEHELFSNDRFLLHISVGTLPHELVMRTIELFGTKVAPVVRRETAARPEALTRSIDR